MSSTYEVVVACHLRDDTPDTVLDTLRWHLGLIEGLPPGVDEEDHPYPLLEPDPHTNAPGGDFASLRQEPTRGWGLFSRNHWLDDDLGQLITLLDLLAPHAETPGYAGHFRELYSATPDLTPFTFADGTYTLHTQPLT
ncbi:MULTISPECIES: hypothetical protein [unclassified Streptomyces]|uniref:hypothetical protein n=1 Tax=unclassified Streptomyces TaxID=2593676 RepID=UPI002DDB0CD3|nr:MULTISPECIES: hypothetical protein [unclassified Streptomyces]WSA91741.1 hypothetical protein OIE63_09345 [Streptomyces sp. NBC_01795]WSB76111.1 hypothetical protein OHB04_10145 [Streptomyces sp. NBC_01775]WSS15615.1 hypothetical protein OG533_29780 [Streptomyces sp. NBC_01186]WSS44456.1 hypothetical protein OG220_30580 [Streptomyces sp. NBC_01187]